MRPQDLDRSEILMYLNTAQLDGALSEMLDECTDTLCKTVQPRTVYRVLDVVHDEKGVCIGGLRLLGDDIALHLSGCEKAVLLAATLSAPVDALIRRAEVTDMTRALMYKALTIVLDKMQVQYEVISDSKAKIFDKLSVTLLSEKLSAQGCELLGLTEADESLESFFLDLVGGGAKHG